MPQLNPLFQEGYAHFFLFLATGNTKHVSKLFPRKRGVKRAKKVSSPPATQPKRKKLRNHAQNAWMDIKKAHERFVEEGYVRSHSHKIGHVVAVNGLRLMSNYQKLPSNVRELPYHRNFEPSDWEHANVGPQPVRN